MVKRHCSLFKASDSAHDLRVYRYSQWGAIWLALWRRNSSSSQQGAFWLALSLRNASRSAIVYRPASCPTCHLTSFIDFACFISASPLWGCIIILWRCRFSRNALIGALNRFICLSEWIRRSLINNDFSVCLMR